MPRRREEKIQSWASRMASSYRDSQTGHLSSPRWLLTGKTHPAQQQEELCTIQTPNNDQWHFLLLYSPTGFIIFFMKLLSSNSKEMLALVYHRLFFIIHMCQRRVKKSRQKCNWWSTCVTHPIQLQYETELLISSFGEVLVSVMCGYRVAGVGGLLVPFLFLTQNV